MKKCFICSKTKPLSEFYKRFAMGDGHLGKCKGCTKTIGIARYTEKKKDPEWVKKERKRCREKSARKRAEIRARGEKEKSYGQSEVWSERNPEKRLANQLARQAYKKGFIKKPLECLCGHKTPDLEMHHQDYSKPLEVVWICIKCHGKTRWKDNPLTFTARDMENQQRLAV